MTSPAHPRASVPRVYTVPALVRDLSRLVARLPSLWSIWAGRRMDPALREKIIVAVAKVNACRMCEHAHTRMALDAGVSDRELAALEGLDESQLDRETWLAVSLARERTKRDFDATEPWDPEIESTLGMQACRDVEDVAHAMTVANRVANTLNALSDRCRGRPVPGSRLPDEIFINLAFLPGAWLGTLVAAARQRKSPFAVWRQARGITR